MNICRPGRLAAAVLALGAISSNSQTPRPNPPNPVPPGVSQPATSKAGRVLLTVVNSLSSQPVRGARVTLLSTAATSDYLATIPPERAATFPGLGPRPVYGTTAADGTVEIQAEPGSYYVAAMEAQGFHYEPPDRATTSIVPIMVVEDKVTNAGRIPLDPTGAVEGTLLDEKGSPLRGASVSAIELAYNTSTGVTSSQVVGTASTNDQGQYRIFNLPAGRYFLRASATSLPTSAGTPEMGYPAMFYPSGEVAQGSQITLVPGGSFRADFHLNPVPLFQVRGRIAPSASGAAQHVELRSCNVSSVPFFSSDTASASGDFEVPGVPPGSYCLTLSEGQKGIGLPRNLAGLATVPVTVTDRDVDVVSLAAEPAITLSGSITSDDRSAARAIGLELVPFGGGTMTLIRVDPDGTFHVPGVLPQSYRIRTLIASQSYVRTVRLGGREFSNGVVELHDSSQPLQIVMHTARGRLSLRLKSASSDPVGPTHVTLFPVGPLEGRVDLTRSVVAQNGQIDLTDLPAGSYRVFPWGRYKSKLAEMPEFLALLPGPTVSVTDEQTASLEVAVLTAKQIDDAQDSLKTPPPTFRLLARPSAGQSRLSGNASSTGKLTLTVLTAQTNQPFGGGEVQLERLDAASERTDPALSATSDATGHAEFRDLPPGTYRVFQINGRGFRYSAASPFMPATAPVRIAVSQTTQGGEVRVYPSGEIRGTVLDERGEPVAGAAVRALSYRIEGPEKILRSIDANNTDDRGSFVLSNITTPGRVFLVAIRTVSALDALLKNTPFTPIGPTYYPNATSFSDAVPLNLSTGAQLDHIDIRVREAAAYRIHGTVTGIPREGTRPTLRLQTCTPGTFDDFRSPLTAVLRSDDTFDAQNIPPGDYCLSLYPRDTVNPSAASPQGFTTFAVTDHNLEGIQLVVHSPVALTGTIRAEVGLAIPATLNLTQLPDRDSTIPVRVDPATGAFHLDAATVQRYRITLTGLPAGVYIKSIKVGDSIINDDTIDLATASGPLIIELAVARTRLSGRVTAGLVPATVTLAPVGSLSHRRDLYRSAVTNAQGEFEFSGIAPGNYNIYAWETIDPRLALVSDFLALVPSTSVQITNEDTVLGVARISPQDYEQALAKF